jgi:hypothetical protein
MIFTLYRDYRDARCTLGTIEAHGRRVQSLERPWVPSTNGGIGGQKGVSCVPPGRYRLFPHSGEAFKNVWALVNPALDVYHWDSQVPAARRGKARTTVLIHPANYVSELRGCIAPGKERKRIDGKEWAVFRSRDALNELRQWATGALDLWLDIDESRLPRQCPRPEGETTP